jgi:hypothetical protein
MKSSGSELVSSRRSTVLILPPQKGFPGEGKNHKEEQVYNSKLDRFDTKQRRRTASTRTFIKLKKPVACTIKHITPVLVAIY